MAIAYRSVKVIVQNSTNDELTIEGYDILAGNWVSNSGPAQNGIVSRQSTARWETESQQLSVGTQAYVRMGSTKGYIEIEWSQPWVGDLECAPVTPDGIGCKREFNLDVPASPVVLITLFSSEKKTSSTSSTQAFPGKDIINEGSGEVIEVKEASTNKQPVSSRRRSRKPAVASLPVSKE